MMDGETDEPEGSADPGSEPHGAVRRALSPGASGAQPAVYLRTRLDRSADPMLIADDHRRWVTGNAAACDLLGLALQEVCWHTMDEFTAPAGRLRLEQQWPAFLGGGSAGGSYELSLPERGPLTVEFSAIAHVLPGRHLVVFVAPAAAEGATVHTSPWVVVADSGRRAHLTKREREVMTLIAAGGRSGDVAQQLFLSGETVKSHVHHAMVKLGARTRAQAVALALLTGQIVWTGEQPDE
jgi:DNA-binding CsgD family transcriptional regulator